MRRLRVVLSCYACEPNRGSEPGIGWAWALGMAKRHETYVLTRGHKRQIIEAELARLSLPENERPIFLYVDLAPFFCRLKKKGAFFSKLYYFLWQLKARQVLNAQQLKADIVHHITFCSFAFVGFWWHRKEAVVIGPLGGTSVCRRSYLRLFPWKQRIKEFARVFSRRYGWRLNPFWMISRHYADKLFFVDPLMTEKMGKGPSMTETLLDVGVPKLLEDSAVARVPEKRNQFAWAGMLEPHKGFEIAVRAFQRAFPVEDARPRLVVCGEGYERPKYERLVRDLGLSDSVIFCGWLPQNDLWQVMRESKGLVFSSVRDTVGSVLVETLSLQTPVICFRHQGAALVTDDTCAIRIEPTSWKASIDGFAKAMCRLHENPELVLQMGKKGRERVLENFAWEKKFAKMDECYRKLVSQREETKKAGS